MARIEKELYRELLPCKGCDGFIPATEYTTHLTECADSYCDLTPVVCVMRSGVFAAVLSVTCGRLTLMCSVA